MGTLLDELWKLVDKYGIDDVIDTLAMIKIDVELNGPTEGSDDE